MATVPQQSQAYTWSFKDSASFLNWQLWMKEMSSFDCVMDVDEDGLFVTLSTCNGLSGTQHRLVLCGKEIAVDQLQEPASWYDGYKNNYDAQVSEARRRADEIVDEVAWREDLAEQNILDIRHGVSDQIE